MHTINLVGKAYIIKVDYKTTLKTTVLENIVIRNGKIITIRFLTTISDLQLKQIIIQENYNIHTYSLFCLAVENSRKTLLLVTYRSQAFLK